MHKIAFALCFLASVGQTSADAGQLYRDASAEQWDASNPALQSFALMLMAGNPNAAFQASHVALARLGARFRSPVDAQMLAAKKKIEKPKPLSPGSNYPTADNQMIQSNGFGTFLQKFTSAKGNTKYGVPAFLPNGNPNPAFLAAEDKELMKQKGTNIEQSEKARMKQVAKKDFDLADFIRDAVGGVGSNKGTYKGGK